VRLGPCYGDRLLNPQRSRGKALFGQVNDHVCPARNVSPHRPSTRAVGATLALSLICVAAGALSSTSPLAQAAGSAVLQEQISAGQSHASDLGNAVGAANDRLAELTSGIASLQHRIAGI
jgi:hypothetical protein